MSHEELMATLSRAIHDGDAMMSASLVRKGLKTGLSPEELMSKCIEAVREVGTLWEKGEYFLPELVSGGEAATGALDVLKPALATLSKTVRQKVAVIGTVKGDIHDIGKTLVAHMLRARGVEVVDLGINVTADDFAASVEEHQPALVAISSLLTTTMLYQRYVVERLVEEGLRERVKVIVGGAPVTPSWVAEIGADGTAEDAIHAADLACELMDL